MSQGEIKVVINNEKVLLNSGTNSLHKEDNKMNILGNGCILGGKYDEEISVLGKATIEGNLHCDSLSCTGLVEGKSELICDNKLYVAGNVFLEGIIRSKSINVTGCFQVKGDVFAEKCIIEGAVESEKITSEIIEIVLSDNVKSAVSCVSGKKILIKRKSDCLDKKKFFFRKKNKYEETYMLIAEQIVGNDVSVEFTKSNRVAGDDVKIGKNCVIDYVQYKDTIEIHDTSVVKKIERI